MYFRFACARGQWFPSLVATAHRGGLIMIRLRFGANLIIIIKCSLAFSHKMFGGFVISPQSCYYYCNVTRRKCRAVNVIITKSVCAAAQRRAFKSRVRETGVYRGLFLVYLGVHFLSSYPRNKNNDNY